MPKIGAGLIDHAEKCLTDFAVENGGLEPALELLGIDVDALVEFRDSRGDEAATGFVVGVLAAKEVAYQESGADLVEAILGPQFAAYDPVTGDPQPAVTV